MTCQLTACVAHTYTRAHFIYLRDIKEEGGRRRIVNQKDSTANSSKRSPNGIRWWRRGENAKRQDKKKELPKIPEANTASTSPRGSFCIGKTKERRPHRPNHTHNSWEHWWMKTDRKGRVRNGNAFLPWDAAAFKWTASNRSARWWSRANPDAEAIISNMKKSTAAKRSSGRNRAARSNIRFPFSSFYFFLSSFLPFFRAGMSPTANKSHIEGGEQKERIREHVNDGAIR